MIDAVEGVAGRTEGAGLALIVGPVTLFLIVPASTAARVKPGQRLKLLAHLYVREDEIRLYGFLTEEERALFRLLLSVNTVGPASALSILSARSPEEIRAAIAQGDRKGFLAIKGIGTKTAERILLELRGKVPPAEAFRPASAPTRDAVAALVAFGQAETDAEEAVRRARERMGPAADAERLVREALKGKT